MKIYKKSWITGYLFIDWFASIFSPEVKNNVKFLTYIKRFLLNVDKADNFHAD